jgi:hypothetical protein
MWFLHRKALVTKDNLLKRNWIGCKKCAFCVSEESVEHLFITCNCAKLVWQVVYFTFNILPSTNIKNLFGKWLNGIDKSTKARISVGVCALLWAIWNCQNDVIFNNADLAHFLQVIHKTIYWIGLWPFLLLEEQRGDMDTGCNHLMVVVWAIFSQGCWQRSNRIQDA